MVFNDGLRARQEAHAAGLPYITDRELSARLTAAKAAPERAWLGEVSAVVLQQALADLNAAYRNFFASVTGKRTGPTVAPPRFRSRKDRRQAIRFTANARFKVLLNGKLRLPKIGDVPVLAGPEPAVRAVQRDRDQGCCGTVLRVVRDRGRAGHPA
jgi:putative transposase